MRPNQLRIGTEVLVRKKGGNRKPTPPRQRGKVIAFDRSEVGGRYKVTVKTEQGEIISNWHPQAQFSDNPQITPSERRVIWIRKDVLGKRAYRRPYYPSFLWEKPKECRRRYYYEYPIHVSHVSGLKVIENAYNDLKKELLEVEEELEERLRFLKARGAMPVDMEVPDSKNWDTCP